MNQIPQMNQPRHPAVSIKIWMQIGNIEVEQGSFQQIIPMGILLDELKQILHIFVQLLPGKAGMLHLSTYNIHSVMAVVMSGQQAVVFRQEIPDCHLVQLVDIFLCDLVRRVRNKFQAFFHTVNAIFIFVGRGKARQNPADTFPGSVDLLNTERGNNFVFHSLKTVMLCAGLWR